MAPVMTDMQTHGAGSQRIAVIGDQRPPRDAPAPREPARRTPMQQPGWTTRRLTIGGALGATAVLAGGLMFTWKFGASGANASPFLAVGFGMFAIGMVVFCACLIALIGTGIIALSERRGWARTALFVFAPLALVWALWSLGAVGYAIPAVLSLVLIGGLLVALK